MGELKMVVAYLGMFNFNIDLAAPECFITPPPDFIMKWYVKISIPFIMDVVIAFAFVGLMMLRAGLTSGRAVAQRTGLARYGTQFWKVVTGYYAFKGLNAVFNVVEDLGYKILGRAILRQRTKAKWNKTYLFARIVMIVASPVLLVPLLVRGYTVGVDIKLSDPTSWPWSVIAFVGFLILVLLSFIPALSRQVETIALENAELGTGMFRVTVSQCVGLALGKYYLFYLYMARNVLDIFNCAANPLTPDGEPVLQAALPTSIRCYKDMSHIRLIPWAIMCGIICVAGYPIICACVLFMHRHSIKEDQVLRAKAIGETKTDNPQLSIRQRYYRIYYYFTPQRHYWILVILARKFLIAFVGLVFMNSPSFQLSVALLVMFVSYVLQVRCRPYMGLEERIKIVKDRANEEKAKMEEMMSAMKAAVKMQKKDPTAKKSGSRRVSVSTNDMTTALVAGLSTPAGGKKLFGVKRQETRLPDSIAGQASKRTLAKLQATMKGRSAENKDVRAMLKKSSGWFANLNTVEAILLSSGVLVNLSGIMFQSERFGNGEDVGELMERQRSGLMYMTMLLIGGSIAYYISVFIAEVVGQQKLIREQKLNKKKAQARAAKIKRELDNRRHASKKKVLKRRKTKKKASDKKSAKKALREKLKRKKDKKKNKESGAKVAPVEPVGPSPQEVLASLDPARREALEKTFKGFDGDNSGTVSIKELKIALAGDGPPLSDKDVIELMSEVDKDGSGEVDFAEFCVLMKDVSVDVVVEEVVEVEAQVADVTRAQRKQIMEIFGRFDKDGSGSIDASELKDAMQAFGFDFDDEQLKNTLESVHVEVGEDVEYPDFEIIVAKLLGYTAGTSGMDDAAMEKIKSIFAKYDGDGSGAISATELNSALKDMGYDPSAEELNNMLTAFDSDKSGEVDFEEFARMVNMLSG